MPSRALEIEEKIYPEMRNIQVIDGARNCAYDIFAATEEEFSLIFPEKDQDIEFIEDVRKRVDEKKMNYIFNAIWQRRVNKKLVQGIHGTLFYELEYKKKYYPTKIDKEML